jgi:hypothetical protein
MQRFSSVFLVVFIFCTIPQIGGLTKSAKLLPVIAKKMLLLWQICGS